MGNSQSSHPFSHEQMEEFVDCTFFTKREIIRHLNYPHHRLYHYYQDHEDPSLNQITKDNFLNLHQIAVNPFKERIFSVFSSNGEGITFDDFLDLFSAFSQDATIDVKTRTAFKIYDFNDNGYIDKEDIEQLVHLVVGEELKEEEIAMVCKKIVKEVDVDGDNQLSYVEFDQILARQPDFVNFFSIKVL